METSCGFILINYDSVLLLQYPQGHWSFPKGHVEASDLDNFSTAQRELLEETGISKVSLIDFLEKCKIFLEICWQFLEVSKMH